MRPGAAERTGRPVGRKYRGEATGGETTGETTGEETTSEPLTPGEGALVVYSGRSEELVGPILEQLEERSGIDVQVRYGETAELAATIIEEGENSPADLFFAQDPGALGALDDEGRLTGLPQGILDRVPSRFRADDGNWVGISGRARVVAYNTEELSEEDLPPSIFDFTDPEWEGRIGWAPINGSFQAFAPRRRSRLQDRRARSRGGRGQGDSFPEGLTSGQGAARYVRALPPFSTRRGSRPSARAVHDGRPPPSGAA